MFGSGQNKQNALNVIFDIRNSSVGIAIWENIKNEPTIIYTDRQYILFDDIQNNENFIENIYKTIDQIINRIVKSELNKRVKKVSKIDCFLAYPWYKAEIKNIKIKENKTKVFNDSYLENKINNLFKIKTDEFEVENKILSVHLNGYEINNPKNKEFEEISLSLYKSFIGLKTKEELENKFQNFFEPQNIKFHTHPISIISVLRKNFHLVDNFSLFDIGGEATEIINFDDGFLSELTIIPNGFNYLIRKLSENINETKNGTFSKMKLLTENELQDENIEIKLINTARDWFNFTSENKKNDLMIRDNIFITVDDDFTKIIKKIFSTKEFYRNSLRLEKEPIVRIINSESTKNLANYAKNVEKDPLLSMLFNFSTIDFQ